MKKTVSHLTLILFILLSCAKDGKRIFVEGKVLQPMAGVTFFATEDLSWGSINKTKGAFF